MNYKYKDWLMQIAFTFGAILFAMFIGSLVIMFIGKNPITVYQSMLQFTFGRSDSIGAILFKSTPLIFAGLAVALSFRVGLFNIGAEGQYFIGALAASIVGFSLQGLPWFIHLPLVILAGMAGGMLWALIPALLKVKRGAHEVITTIMMNYIAYSVVHYFVADLFLDKAQNLPKGYGSPMVRMPKILESARMPTMHDFVGIFGVEMPRYIYLNWFFVIGILLAIAVYILIWKTPFGMEIRAVGQNPHASETVGIQSKKVYLKTFLISGAIAGLIGLSDLLGYIGYMDTDFPRGYGFTGIAVALLANNNALGVVLAALLFGFLRRGAEGLQAIEQIPMDVVVILEGVIILSIVVASQLMRRYFKTQEKKREKESQKTSASDGDKEGLENVE